MNWLKHPGVQTRIPVLNQQDRAVTSVTTPLPFLTVIILFLIIPGFISAQTAGDYRSNATSMNWNAAASWQKFDGTSWVASSDYPGQNTCSSCTVTIQNGHTVTTNITPPNSIGNLVVGGGTNGTLTLGTFSLTVSGNFTLSAGATINLATGTFTVNGTSSLAGTVSDASNTGVNTFTGLVTKTAGTWASTSVTTASNLIFSSGFTNTAGAFNAGAATAGDNQTLTGTVTMTFNNGLTVLGNGDLNVAGTATTGVALAGTSINYAFRNLNLTGLLTVSTTGNFSVSGTTNITGTGAFTDNNNTGITSFAGAITHNSTGSWNTVAVTTPANMLFGSGITNTAGAFSAGGATIADNQTLTGTINMSFANGITVQGNGDLNIAGTASSGVSFAGTGINYSLRNLNLTGLLTVSTTGNLTVNGTTNMTGTGAFTDNNNAGITTFNGTITHNSTGGWNTTTVTTPANMVFNANITNTAGAFSAGGATVADNLTLTGTVNMSFVNGLTVLGNGDITIAGTATTGATFGGTAINYAVRNLTLTGRLTVSTSGNLTVSGTTNITGTGAFWDSNNSGVTTFNGTVTHNSTGNWTSTTVTTAANMVFNANVINTAGSFSAGGATFADNLTLDGTIVMIFYSPITINGAGNITFSGTGGVRLAGTLQNYTIPGNLNLTGTLLVSTTGNFTVNGNFNITSGGDFTDNNNTGISTFNGPVVHNSSGRWVTTSVTSTTNLVFNSSVTNTAGSFSAGGATIADNQTLTGTVNMSFNRGLTVLGNGDISIAGTASTGVSFTGTSINYAVRNITITGLLTVSTSGNFTVSGTTSLSGSGAFLDNNGTGITTFTGLVTIGSSSTFTATSVTTVGRLLFGGGIIHNNTTASSFNAGTIRTTATQSWSGAGTINTTGVIDVSTGTLTNSMTGRVNSSGSLTGAGTFVQDVNAYLQLGSTTPLTITTLTSTATGNTVEYRSAGNATIRSQTYHHLVITGSGTKTISTTDITVNGNLTISAGILSNTTNNRNITIAGNWINNASTSGFAAGTGTVTFNGSSTQTLGGSFATTFRNLTLNNASGIIMTAGATISGTLTLTTGLITTGTNTVTISSTGSVTRTSGYIFGNEQRNIATGTNVSRTYDIGDASNYTPVTLLFASVSVAGNVTISTTTGDHPNIVSAYLNSTLSVNRYWTISNSATTFTSYTATLNFVAGDRDASLNTSNVIAGRYSSGWTYPAVGTKTSTSTQVTGLTAFGDLAIAEQLPCSTPTVVITDPSPFCSPATVDLTAAAITAGSSSGLTYTYWRDISATISLSTPSAVGTAGTYYIKGTVALGGCADIKPVVVTRNNPTGVISGSTAVCTGSSANLSIEVTGTGPWSGTLSDGTGFSGSSSPVIVSVSPVTNTTFTISTLSDAGCTAQAADKTGSALVSLTPLPTTANAGPDQSLCGISTTLAANTPTVGTGAWTIVSGTGGSFANSTSATTTFTGTAGTAYTLRWSISNAPCNTSTDDVVITFTSGVWTGTVSNDWNNSGNWCGGIIPSGIIDLTLPAGLPNYPSITGNIILNDVSISSGASLSIAAAASITIRGNCAINGTLHNDGAVIMNGTGPQTFPGGTATISLMRDFEVDNTGGITIDQSFGITGTLTPTEGTIDLADKKITLISNATGTARVAPVTGSFAYSAGGKFIVQRYVPARRAWRLITSPLTGAGSIYDSWQNGGVYTAGVGTFITGPGGGNGLDADGGSSFKVYNTATQTLDPVLNTNISLSGGSNGSGDNSAFFLFVRGDRNPANLTPPSTNATTLASEGQLQTGAQTFNASSVGGQYTLVGNPYASPIDFNGIARTNLVKRFYVWDPSLNTVGGYVTMDDVDNDGVYSKSVAGSNQTTELLSHQAFFVETAASGSASISINETDKTDGSSYVISRPMTDNRQYLNINLYLLNNDGTTILADGTRAEFSDSYNNGVNFEDAMKFGNINETFSLLHENKALALERKPLMISDTLFLRLTKSSRRLYQLRLQPHNMDANPQLAFLKDNYLGTETMVSLTDSTAISFAINTDAASAAANRFSIVFKPMNVLPVKFVAVNGNRTGNRVQLQWAVANEINVRSYTIERSADGRNFSNVATVTAINNSNANTYHGEDASATSAITYYRIAMLERNGTTQYSAVIRINADKQDEGVAVFPNPVTDNKINLQFSNQQQGNYMIRLFSNNGQLLHQETRLISNTNTAISINIPGKLVRGEYQLEITSPAQTKALKQILVQ